MDELCDRTAHELVQAMISREVSAREVLDAHLARVEHWNPQVNAIVTRTDESARGRAAALDEALARGEEPGPLHGLPIAHKDLVDTAGVLTTYGSLVFAEHVPAVTEPFVERVRDAGAVMVGKTNTSEFGAGSHTFNAVFGITRNPYDLNRSAGGSSGGAAAALATGMLPIADGSDHAASLRNPASFCNVVGFRPSLPEDDELELSTEGPMARTVEDAALLWSVMSGEPGRASVSRGSLSGWRVAWAPAFAGTLPVEPAVATALEPASVVIEGLGCVLVDRYPDLDGARETFFTLRARSFAEELGYLLPEHRDEIKATVVWNIEQGFNVSEGDVARAVDRMRAIREASESFFDDVDVLVQPVTQVVPFDADLEYPTNVAGAPMDTYLDWMASCWTISVLGGPAISVPFGFTGEGLPVGIQIVGRRGDDRRVLQFAWAFEAATLAGERRPVASDVGEPRREIP